MIKQCSRNDFYFNYPQCGMHMNMFKFAHIAITKA